MVERIGDLQEEKFNDQARILEVKRDLMVRRGNELKVVQNTVQTEMKSYYYVEVQSLSAALAPKKIEAAVKKCRKKIIVVAKMLSFMGLKKRTMKVEREN